MRVLIIKTSSLGDIIHTFPALTDAQHHFSDIQFDWIVEEAFQEIPLLHPAVRTVIPMAYRRWRKNWRIKANRQALIALIKRLKQEKYDVIIDAQGLLKSAWLCLLAKGPSYGLDWHSAREALASLFYRHKLSVEFEQHAIHRMREIFAKSLGYPMPTTLPSGLDKNRFALPAYFTDQPYFMCLHGTTWLNKRWPVLYWNRLIAALVEKNFTVLIPWSTQVEYAQAITMKDSLPNVHVLPKLSLLELTAYLAHAKGIIAVDSGLAHLTAALNTPSLSLYGPTDPSRTGTVGPQQWHLKADFPCAPCLQRTCQYQGPIKDPFPACFSTIPPEKVLQEMESRGML